jgi:MoaA/NifB/PqqE/SkfB family radical SAM enzyme
MQLRGPALEELATAGLGELKLSIDGGAQAEVEYMRDGADLGRVLENSAAFAGRSPTPVTIYTVLNRRHAASIPGLADLAARAGARRIEAVETVPFRDGSTEREVYDRREYQFATLPRAEQARLLGELRRAARAKGVEVRVYLRWERTRCREPMTKLYVDVEGNVTPCCRIHHEVLAGNILRDACDAVWRGPVLTRWRAALQRRELQPRICVERCHLGLRVPR